MNLTKKRKIFKKIYSPLGAGLIKIGLSPNQITIMAFFFGMLAAYFYIKNNYIIAALLLLCSGTLDLLDGIVATEKKKATKAGAVFDWIGDKTVDASVIGAIGLTYATSYVTLIAVTGSLLNTFIKPVMHSEIGYSKRIKGKIESPLEGIGIFGRPETHITIIIFSVLHYFNFFGVINLNLCIIIIAVFTNISLMQRLIYLYKKYNIPDTGVIK